MGCEAGAEVVFAREGDFGDCLEDGGFSGRLVSADDDLGEGDKVVDTVGAELVDFVEELELFAGLEGVEGFVGGEGGWLGLRRGVGVGRGGCERGLCWEIGACGGAAQRVGFRLRRGLDCRCELRESLLDESGEHQDLQLSVTGEARADAAMLVGGLLAVMIAATGK